MIDLEILLATVLWGILLTLPAFFITLAKQKPAARQKAFDKAIRSGKKVIRATGVLVRSYYTTDPVTHHPTRRGVYEYVHKGRTYKYRMYSQNPPTSISLSFFNNYPRGATTGVIPNTKNRFVGVVITFVVMTFLSYFLVRYM